MKLYYMPGACSLGIHALLAKVEAPYEMIKVDLHAREQHSAWFCEVNPSKKVPVIVLPSGIRITEYAAISVYIAKAFPSFNLVPEDPIDLAHALEVIAYVTQTVHGQGFTRIVRSERFSPQAADYPAVRAKGHRIFVDGLIRLSAWLGDRRYVLGKTFSIADAAVFYVCFWAVRHKVTALPEALARHYRNLADDAAFAKALSEEELA